MASLILGVVGSGLGGSLFAGFSLFGVTGAQLGGALGSLVGSAIDAAIAPGDTVTVAAGCNKQFSTCKTKFANGVNHRGFPYMPGNDAALAPPTQTQPLDGGSRYGN